ERAHRAVRRAGHRRRRPRRHRGRRRAPRPGRRRDPADAGQRAARDQPARTLQDAAGDVAQPGRRGQVSVSPFTALACPLDGAPLQRSGASWRCADGHCFDIAAQGYVNLLPVQNKRSLDPGDSKEMVAARRRFLEAGHYQPIADAVAQAVLAGAAPGRTLTCLDAGCGEGYYLRQLATAAAAEARPLALAGLDISKWAVQAAAKRDLHDARSQAGASAAPCTTWIVGSNAGLPVLPATLDRVLCMFGFPVYPEFARVLRRGGELLQVDAGS